MPARMAVNKIARNCKYWRGYRQGNLIHCWWECTCKLVQQVWYTVWRFLPELRRKLSHDSAISLLGLT